MQLTALRDFRPAEIRANPILQVLPRGMRYSLATATSIDLFVCEVAAHSRLRVEVVAESSDPALPAAAIHNLPAFGVAKTLRRARFIADLARGIDPSAIVVQQHLPSAAAVARSCARPSFCKSIISCGHRGARDGRARFRNGVIRARSIRSPA